MVTTIAEKVRTNAALSNSGIGVPVTYTHMVKDIACAKSVIPYTPACRVAGTVIV